MLRFLFQLGILVLSILGFALLGLSLKNLAKMPIRSTMKRYVWWNIILVSGFAFLSACSGQPNADPNELPADLALSSTSNTTAGDVQVGRTGEFTITLFNYSPIVTGTAITNIGVDNPNFAYTGGSYPGTNGTCTSDLVGFGSCTIELEFSPAALGQDTTTITLSYQNGLEAQQTELEIDGNGVPFILEPDAITDLVVATRRTDALEISWSAPNDQGTPITDYFIEYKLSSSSTWILANDGTNTNTIYNLPGLSEDTSYDFRVQAYNGSPSAYSNLATESTLPNDPFFLNGFRAFNLGGATTSKVVSLDDNNVITRNGAPLATLQKGETFGFASALNDILEGSGAFYTAGRAGAGGAQTKGNLVWSTPDWVSRNFLFNANRDPDHVINIRSFGDNNTIRVFQNGIQVASTTINNNANHSFLLSANGSYQMTSTEYILAYQYSQGAAGDRYTDPKPLLPASNSVLGIPSSSMRLSSSIDGNNYTAVHSNSTTAGGTANINSYIAISPQGTSNQYNPMSLLITGTGSLVGFSYADSNGYCSAPFIPTSLLRYRYAINTNSDWVAFASTQPGVINIIRPDTTTGTVTLTRSGAAANAPYKARVTGADAVEGTRYESSTRFGAWYQPNNDNFASDEDETILYGANPE